MDESKRPKCDDNPPSPPASSFQFEIPTDDDDDDELLSEEEDCDEEALRNALILNLVLKDLPTSQLLLLAFVSRAWKEGVASEMLRRNAFQISLKYCPSSRTFQALRTPWSPIALDPKNEWSLDTLNSCIRNSIKFPCNSFHFYGGNLAVPPVIEFFNLIGPKIKSLGLHGDLGVKPTITTTNKSILLDILSKFAPNIEYLQLDESFNYSDYWSLNISDDLNLPRLTYLNFLYGLSSCRTSFILLRASKNLQTISQVNCNPNFTSILIQMDKMKLVKSLLITQLNLTITTSIEQHLAGIQKLNLGLRGREWRESWEQTEIMQSFFKILHRVNSTLKYLEIFNHDEKFYGTLQIPSLKQLKEISFVQSEQPQPQPQVEANPRENRRTCNVLLCPPMPNLTKLSLDKNCWFYFFRFSEHIIQTVKTFEIWGWQPKSYVFAHLLRMCPRVRNLVVHLNPQMEQFDLKESCYLTWQQYRHLTLIIDHLEPNFNLDAILTGFSLQTVKHLYEREGNERIANSHTLREFHWIGGNQKLESLKILFGDVSKWGKTDPAIRSVPISKVSCLYAFQLLPDLNITVGYDHHDPFSHLMAPVIEPIHRYAKVIHFKMPPKINYI